MKLPELEHIIRASSAITQQEHFVVIGSQALLGTHPDAPVELLASMEVDLYPRDAPEDSILIDGSIGEGSTFHKTFGYYAHGVGPETATLPEGWEGRLVPVCSENTKGATGWCLEVHDLAASKLIAGRPWDLDFVRNLNQCAMVDLHQLAERLLAAPTDPQVLRRSLDVLKALTASDDLLKRLRDSDDLLGPLKDSRG
jgi:hypothetical protein